MREISGLGWRSLCVIALTVGCVDATLVQWSMATLGYENYDNFWTETLQGAFGRVLGSFIFLAVSLEVRRHLLRSEAE